MRTIAASVEGENLEKLVIEVTGPACFVQDAQILLSAQLRQIKRDFEARKAINATRGAAKPCGCKDAASR